MYLVLESSGKCYVFNDVLHICSLLTSVYSFVHSKWYFPTASFKTLYYVSLVSDVVCHLCVCLSTSKPREALSCSLWFCVCQNPNHHTFPSPSTHTHARSIGVQSGKGLSVVLCEWPLLKQINRHWHVPPPTKRKQLKAIDPVPGSSMNMHVSLTFPWRGEERETDRLTDRCRSTPLPISCNVNWFVTVLCVAMDCSFLCESAHIKSPTCLPSVHEANRRIKACETSCSFISPF